MSLKPCSFSERSRRRYLCASIFAFLIGAILVSCGCRVERKVDVLVVGGGASGVSAAIQASRMGSTVLVAEESPWLGGMLTSAGVSAVDGNFRMPAGIFGEFRARLADYYGGLDSLKTGWVSQVLFEPSVGNEIFKDMLAAEPGVDVVYDTRLVSLEKDGHGEWLATLEGADGEFRVSAKVVIDGTELGDIAKMTGVKYDIGMESADVTHEDIAPAAPNGIIQDLTMVATLKDYGHDVTMSEPADYDPDEFACTAINRWCKNPKEPNRMWSPDLMITYGKLPNGKYMINWPIEGNDYYINIIELPRDERDSLIADAKAHTMRFIYFIQKELGFNTLGLADDEYPTDDLLPFIPYHRESRRIHGKVRFDLNHIMNPYSTAQPLYRTSIAVGDYPVDHHHKAYSGSEELPDLYFHPVPSYGLPLGVIMPDTVTNLLVTEKSISVSNIVNGTTRLQPVVMQIGQAAGAVAALAVKNGIAVSDVDVRDVQNAVLDAGGYLLPYLDVPLGDSRFKPYQRIGATGILRGKGQSISWSNETWLRADDPLLRSELSDFESFYNVELPQGDDTESVTLGFVASMIGEVAGREVDCVKVLKDYGVDKDVDNVLTRGEFALLVDELLDPFNSRRIQIDGNFK